MPCPRSTTIIVWVISLKFVHNQPLVIPLSLCYTHPFLNNAMVEVAMGHCRQMVFEKESTVHKAIFYWYLLALAVISGMSIAKPDYMFQYWKWFIVSTQGLVGVVYLIFGYNEAPEVVEPQYYDKGFRHLLLGVLAVGTAIFLAST